MTRGSKIWKVGGNNIKKPRFEVRSAKEGQGWTTLPQFRSKVNDG